jgi:hypothetical protein
MLLSILNKKPVGSGDDDLALPHMQYWSYPAPSLARRQRLEFDIQIIDERREIGDIYPGVAVGIG